MANTPRLDKLDRNYLINGNFDFWQRGTSTTGAVYLADRWKGNGTLTAYSRQSGGPNTSSQYFARISVTSGFCTLQQRIESNFTRYIQDSKMTISFWAKVSTGTSPLTFAVQTPTVVDNYAAINTLVNAQIGTLTTSWQKFAYTFDVTGLMQSNGFLVDVGNNLNSGALTIDIAQVMLNEGSFASTFAMAGKSFIDERMLTMRYYQRGFNDLIGMWDSTTNLRVAAVLPVPMRVAPSLVSTGIAVTSVDAWGVNGAQGASSFSAVRTSTTAIQFAVTTTAYTQFRCGSLNTDSVGADAEL